MSDETWSWRIERQLPSEISAGEKVIRDVVDQLHAQQWPERDVFGVHMALEEGLVNAIRHGNCLDSNKRVHVVCKLSPERLRIEITDEGPGFNPDCVPDCTAT